MIFNKSNKPLVAINCITYNHEAYIRNALEGFVMQKTNFPFVAIVHDDCSTDKSCEIIQEYQQKYPDIIKPIYESENQYSKKDGSLRRIVYGACINTGAKYIAMCEGDDYWTDPYKLQKQVDFLEANPEYSMCFHRVDVLNENTKSIDTGCSNVQSKDYEHRELQSRLNVPTCSVVMKAECLSSTPIDSDFIVGDNVLWATCRSMGKVRGFSDVMGVYRRVSTGWTAQFTKSGKDKFYNLLFDWIKHRRAMKRHFPDIEESILDDQIIENMAMITLLDIRIYHSNFRKNFSQFFKEYKCKYVAEIFRVFSSSLISKIKNIFRQVL